VSTEARPRAGLVFILGALCGLGPLCMDMYLPGMPELGDDLGASASATQLTLSSCFLGLALGQVAAGPLSDRLGRRAPLLIGLAAYAAVSALCALAPSMATLVVLRGVQGFAASAGIVIARAMVRDMVSGLVLARVLSSLLLVQGLTVVLAPLVGAQLLHVTSWRGIFLVLAAIGVVLILLVLVGTRETLPHERRREGGLLSTAGRLRLLLRDRPFVGYGLAFGMAFGALFTYISGSPFVLQEIHGLSPQAFSVSFAVNALGLIGASQASGRLVGRVAPGRLLMAGLSTMAGGGTLVLAGAIAGLGVWPTLVGLFAVVSGLGLSAPNAMALALDRHPADAGSAAGLLGVWQYMGGAIGAPVAGAAGSGTAVPMAVAIAALALLALLVVRATLLSEGALRGT
jgi:MFS transporter, DHA1 family, multidrug resistance protein